MPSVATSLLVLLTSTAHAAPLLDQGAVLEPSPAEELGPVDAPGPHRIWNGDPVPIDEHENVVALAMSTPWGDHVFCSGSLIHPEWVLTAAHCLEDLEGYDLLVAFGGDLRPPDFPGVTDVIEIAQTFPHPQYDASSFSHDIGLVRLAAPKTGVDLVVLNDESLTDSWYGDELTLLGFGVTGDGRSDSGLKRITWADVVGWDSQYLYTDDPNTNVCQGDSGGPAFETTQAGTLEQAGVNAFVFPGCIDGSAGLTRVDRYIDWIQGYVPDVLLSGSGEGSGGEPEPELPDPDDEPEIKQVDPDKIDRDLGEVPDPTRYPVGMRCDATAPAGAAGWLVVGFTALAVRLRRDNA